MSKKSHAKNALALLALALVLVAAGLLNRLAGPSLAEGMREPFEPEVPTVFGAGD